MEHIAVILNAETTTHPAVYFAYHFAARSAAELIGVAVLDFQALEDAKKSLADFSLGARAAGIRARSFMIPTLTDHAIKELKLDFNLILLGMEMGSGNRKVKNYIAQCAWPVWLVPEGQHYIRRVLLIVENAPFQSAAAFHGLDLVRKWNLDLVVEGIEEEGNQFKFFSELDWIHIPVIQTQSFDRDKINALIFSEQIDLVMIDRETLSRNNWDLSCCPNSVIAIYPPQAIPRI